MFLVTLAQLGEDIQNRARTFAEAVVNETHDRFAYDYDRRVETIYIGKLAEEAFIYYASSELEIQLESNYEIYAGTTNVDENDFLINGFNIDIKSSKDTDNRGIEACYRSFNFPVPTDQSIKDITISIIYDTNVENFYIASWIDKDKYSKNAVIGNLPVGGGVYKEFYKYPIRNGYPISELKNYLKLKNDF